MSNPTGKWALATLDSGLRTVKFPSMLTQFFPVFLTLLGMSKSCRMRSFTERSKKCICCGIFYSACGLHVDPVFIYSLWHKKQKFSLLLRLSPPSFTHVGCGFRKGTADFSFLGGSRRESIPSLSCLSWFLSQFSHPLATQNSSAGVRRAASISDLQFQCISLVFEWKFKAKPKQKS